MLEEILKYERNAFFFLNGSDSPFLDHFMWLFSGKIVWIPLALIIICTLAYKKNWRETVFILLAIALTITLCDQFASHICKPIFHRFRPTHHPDFMEEVKVVFGYRGGRYGFISSHDLNNIFSSARFPLDQDESRSFEDAIMEFIQATFSHLSPLQKVRTKGILKEIINDLNINALTFVSIDETKASS